MDLCLQVFAFAGAPAGRLVLTTHPTAHRAFLATFKAPSAASAAIALRHLAVLSEANIVLSWLSLFLQHTPLAYLEVRSSAQCETCWLRRTPTKLTAEGLLVELCPIHADSAAYNGVDVVSLGMAQPHAVQGSPSPCSWAE
jgi:hypothetical protein